MIYRNNRHDIRTLAVKTITISRMRFSLNRVGDAAIGTQASLTIGQLIRGRWRAIQIERAEGYVRGSRLFWRRSTVALYPCSVKWPCIRTPGTTYYMLCRAIHCREVYFPAVRTSTRTRMQRTQPDENRTLSPPRLDSTICHDGNKTVTKIGAHMC